jgi:hypothetical protein
MANAERNTKEVDPPLEEEKSRRKVAYSAVDNISAARGSFDGNPQIRRSS